MGLTVLKRNMQDSIIVDEFKGGVICKDVECGCDGTLSNVIVHYKTSETGHINYNKLSVTVSGNTVTVNYKLLKDLQDASVLGESVELLSNSGLYLDNLTVKSLYNRLTIAIKSLRLTINQTPLPEQLTLIL